MLKAERCLRTLVGIVLVGLLLAACSTSAGTSTRARIPRVAMMHVGTDHNPPSLATLVTRLGELGWFDGSADQVMHQLVGDGATKVQGKMAQLRGQFDGPRIELIWRNLEPAEVEAQAVDFVRQHVDVIVAFEDKSIRAAQDATAQQANRIPIVFLHPSDPVRDGLVASLSHPGGNLTGVFGARDPVVKQLELYKQIVPGVHRLLTLVDRTDPATPPLLPQAQAAANRLGLDLELRYASGDTDLDRVFESVAPGQFDGVFILSPSLRLNHSGKIIALAAAAHLPVQAHRKEWVDPAKVDPGALFSLGVDVAPVGTAGARFVDSLLRGTAPSDLPVQEVPQVEFTISLKRAAELGIEVPEDVIARADKVYR